MTNGAKDIWAQWLLFRGTAGDKEGWGVLRSGGRLSIFEPINSFGPPEPPRVPTLHAADPRPRFSLADHRSDAPSSTLRLTPSCLGRIMRRFGVPRRKGEQ